MGTPKGTIPWNAGTGKGWVDKRGYRWVYVTENGRRRARREHRVFMENHLGRKLEPWEAVHHIDGNAQNNEIDNLEVVEFGKHTSAHHFGTQRPDTMKRTITVFGQMRAEIYHVRKVNTDLLAALEMLLNACMAHNEANTLQMVDPHAEQQARAAIAKARNQ